MSERSSSFVVWWRDHWQDVVPHSPALSDAEEGAWLIWQAALADRPEQPEGWKLVPVQPTGAMLSEIVQAIMDDKPSTQIYRRLLAAAPALGEGER